MPFPESRRVIYGKNPLAEVICQLRFPTILRIDVGQPADFQERIRNEYPLYEVQQPSKDLPQLPRELFSIMEKMMPRSPFAAVHRFSTKDSKRAISVCQDFVAVADSEYERWETFRAEIERAEEALREVYKPAFYTRIGLRYQDIIKRSKLKLDGVEWNVLLKPHIVGELGASEVSGAILTTQTHSLIKIPEVSGGQVRLTHGLHPSPATGEACYLIDADFFIENKEGLGEPFEILDRFNRLAGNLFRWAITDKLHTVMEPRAI